MQYWKKNRFMEADQKSIAGFRPDTQPYKKSKNEIKENHVKKKDYRKISNF